MSINAPIVNLRDNRAEKLGSEITELYGPASPQSLDGEQRLSLADL